MKELHISESILSGLVEEATDLLPYDLLKAGYELYKNGGVISIGSDSAKSEIAAYCKESAYSALSHKVVLDLDFFSVSQCACRSSQYCVHMAAVFFKSYQMGGRRPELLLAELAEQDRQDLSAKVQKKQAHTEQSAKQKMQAMLNRYTPAVGDKPEVWWAYFERTMGEGLSSRSANSPSNSIEIFYNKVVNQMFPLAQEWTTTMRSLFCLHVVLYALEKIEDLVQGIHRSGATSYYNSSYLPYYVSQGVAEVHKRSERHLEQCLTQIQVQDAMEHNEPALTNLKDIVRRNAFPVAASSLDWPGIYKMLWVQLLGNPLWLTQENDALQKWIGAGERNAHQTNQAQLALALIAFLSGDDEACIQWLLACKTMTVKDYSDYLLYIAQSEEWDRLLLWLKQLAPLIRRTSRYGKDDIYQLWLAGANAQPGNPHWQAWIETMLPSAADVYTQYLMENGKSREIVQLLIARGQPIWTVESKLLKSLEKEDPWLVLPLYHQEVERYILEKNRKAYKQAVRYLKKLAQFYKKLKEQERWNLFLAQLVKRHSRLRVLQEELRKGKLIA